MRLRLLISDIFAVLLGLLGLYAILAATLLGAFYSSGLLVLTVLLFVMSMCFLLPGLHNRLVRLTAGKTARMPFVVVSGLWLQMTMGLFVKLEGLPVPLPGWNLLAEFWVWIYGAAAVMLVFSYVFPGAAYDVLRADDDEFGEEDDDQDGDADLPLGTPDQSR